MQLSRCLLPRPRAGPVDNARRSCVMQATSVNSTQQRSLRICTNKTCRRQGSLQILKFAKDLGLEELTIEECGCLGNCGKGPNMVLLPEELRLRHVSTPADMLSLLQGLNINIPPEVLQATELRLAGNALAERGDPKGAVGKYQEALALAPSRGQHMIYSNLAAAYQHMGKTQEALSAAEAAVRLAPKGFHAAYVRYVDALYACNRCTDAAVALQEAVARDKDFKTIPEYKMMERVLQQYTPRMQA